MKFRGILFAILVTFAFVIVLKPVAAVCCGNECYEGGICDTVGLWYEGCVDASGQVYSNNAVLGECLTCVCTGSGPGNTCDWGYDHSICQSATGNSGKVCTYTGAPPTSSSCSDADDSEANCNLVENDCTRSTTWSKAGEIQTIQQGIWEYFDTATYGCCGDDSGENHKTSTGDGNDGTSACCNDATDCVKGSTCYANTAIYTGTGSDLKCKNGVWEWNCVGKTLDGICDSRCGTTAAQCFGIPPGTTGAGGNTVGCDADPDAWRCDANCAYTTLNCDNNPTESAKDRCENVCSGTEIRDYQDYYADATSFTCNNVFGALVEDCATRTSVDSDGGDIPETAGTVTDPTTCNDNAVGVDATCDSTTYNDVCTSTTQLTEYLASGTGYSTFTYTCTSPGIQAAAAGDTNNNPATTGTCTAGTGATCSSGAFTTIPGTSGTEGCTGTCPDSCLFNEYYAIDSDDACTGLDTCTLQQYNPDTNSNTCTTCGQSWNIGGESAAFGEYDTGQSTECCGDDSGENTNQILKDCTQTSCSDNDYPAFTGTGYLCCDNLNDCAYGGVCYTSNADSGSGPYDLGLSPNDLTVICEPDVLGKGTWFDCDNSFGACTGSADTGRCGFTNGWIASGEANVGEYDASGAVECCGDDYNEVYTVHNSDGFFVDETKACCNGENKCAMFSKCIDPNANIDPDGVADFCCKLTDRIFDWNGCVWNGGGCEVEGCWWTQADCQRQMGLEGDDPHTIYLECEV